jgi:dihydropteroate synthase
MKHLIFRNQVLELNGVPRIMGILNVTPDSFYDGGRYFDRSRAEERAFRLVEEGADLLDIGGESTRPGSDSVTPEEEIRRVVPLIEFLAGRIPIPISIDTYKAEVARVSLQAGAEMINDISGLTFDPDLVSVVAESGVPVVLMHTLGRPQVMQGNPVYRNLIAEIKEFLAGAIQKAERSGIRPENIIVDPGIGFGKTVEHNLEIINRLADFQDLGKPVMVGPSRKSFLGKILDEPVDERLEGTLAAVAITVWNGAEIIRVHDVREARKVVRIVTAIKNVKREK